MPAATPTLRRRQARQQGLLPSILTRLPSALCWPPSLPRPAPDGRMSARGRCGSGQHVRTGSPPRLRAGRPIAARTQRPFAPRPSRHLQPQFGLLACLADAVPAPCRDQPQQRPHQTGQPGMPCRQGRSCVRDIALGPPVTGKFICAGTQHLLQGLNSGSGPNPAARGRNAAIRLAGQV